MARQRAFETAAARRRADPVEWLIDGRSILLRASVDLIDIADLLEALNAEDTDPNQVRASHAKRLILIQIIETFVEERSLGAFREVSPDLDGPLLSEMLEELVQEYTGQNPTQAPPSSDGSSETGNSLTDGAPPEASTR